MNFFEAQAVARRSTVWLVLLFSMAVIGLILVTNILVLILSAYLETGQILFAYDTLHGYFQWSRFVAVSIAVTLLILGGSLIKSSQLSAGGHVIAEALGGQFIPQNSPEPHHRKIINVVEEMALASGSPVPKVYLLDEPGINAFAAGWTSSDAVIGITLGAVRQLGRDELQGVIAHEFSHILNGDMRLNIRLTGVLHGILLIGIIGYYLMRVMTYARSSRNEKGGSIVAVVIALGLGLVVIGYIGTFFGNMIKAMVSRQREYLADASSVQFTRNRDGISGALKKIGGIHHGSRLSSPAAPEFSHAYFAQGVSAFMGELFATHPPLKKRILRIDPRWDGKFTSTQASDEEGSSQSESVISDHSKKANHMTAATIGAVVADALHSIDHVGQPSEAHLGYARQLLTEIPAELKAESQDPYGVRALMYALLLHPSAAEQSKQCLLLEELIDAELYKKVMALA
ncbi:MAG: M48 family metallopeptidase, partial [Gammaproteobacteria bacterium]|nr:M48 family metallopeptidase [Gammaproteobacteria bacterium]